MRLKTKPIVHNLLALQPKIWGHVILFKSVSRAPTIGRVHIVNLTTVVLCARAWVASLGKVQMTRCVEEGDIVQDCRCSMARRHTLGSDDVKLFVLRVMREQEDTQEIKVTGDLESVTRDSTGDSMRGNNSSDDNDTIVACATPMEGDVKCTQIEHGVASAKIAGGSEIVGHSGKNTQKMQASVEMWGAVSVTRDGTFDGMRGNNSSSDDDDTIVACATPTEGAVQCQKTEHGVASASVAGGDDGGSEIVGGDMARPVKRLARTRGHRRPVPLPGTRCTVSFTMAATGVVRRAHCAQVHAVHDTLIALVYDRPGDDVTNWALPIPAYRNAGTGSYV